MSGSILMTFGQLIVGIQSWWTANAPLQGKMIATILLLVVIFLLRSFGLLAIRRNVDDTTQGYIWRRRVTHVTSALAIVCVGFMWIDTLRSMAAFLGILGAGLAVAMRDLIMNVVGWIFIHWRRPFSIGDRIEIAGHAGDVIDLNLFQFTLLEVGNWVEADHSTGRIIHVPTAKVLSEPLANYTKGFAYIWNELRIQITFESDWRLAKTILLMIASKTLTDITADAREQIKLASKRYMIFFRKLAPIVYTRVRDSGVELTIRYLTHPRQRRTTEHRLWEAILIEFAKYDNIDFAYPTTRFYRQSESQDRATKENTQITDKE
ncbi:mechanosensitive ion channel [bacterium]|nr:mechanosensitive ion channel [bacterium]